MRSPFGQMLCGNSILTDLASSFYVFFFFSESPFSFFLSLSNIYCTPTRLASLCKREWTKSEYYGIIKDMRKATIEEGKKCPNCGRVENQIKIGYNRSGTQRCRCKECGTRYTIAPKERVYSEEIRESARYIHSHGFQSFLFFPQTNIVHQVLHICTFPHSLRFLSSYIH